MGIPGVSVTEASGIPPLPDTGVLSRVAMIAPSSAGTFDAKPIYALSDLSEFGQGVLVRHGKHLFAETKTPFLAVRCAATNPGTYDTIDNSAVTGTCVPAVVASVVPTNEAELYIKIVTGCTIGVTGGEYRRSDSNGREGTESMPLRALGTASRITFADVNGAIELDPPSAQVDIFIALAVEIRADLLAHFANAVAHNSADATAAAPITLGAPGTGAEAWAVLNQCRTAWATHLLYNALTDIHDSSDLYNTISAPVATSIQTGITLALEFKVDINAHNAATYPAAGASLLALTASTIAAQIYDVDDLIAGGVTQVNRYPSLITFTTSASGTPSDAPATATITGTDRDTGLSGTDIVSISQTAGVATATKLFILDDDFLITYSAGQGTGATISIGTAAAAHNSADVTNTITSTSPTTGTLVAGDIIRVGTNAPTPADSDITAAIAKLVASASTPAIVEFPGRTAASLGATISAGADTMTTAGKPCVYIVQPRQPNSETPEVHVNAVEAEWIAAVTDNRICIVTGDYVDTFNDGAKLRQRFTGTATHFTVRAVNTEYFRTTWRTVQIDKVSIYDTDSTIVGWDEASTPDKPRKVQVFYRVPAGDRPLVPAVDYTLADLDVDRTTTVRERRVTDELHRIVRKWSFAQVGALAATTLIPNTSTGRLNESVRLSFQQSLAAIIAANMGGTVPDVAISDTDKPDLVSINPIVTVAGAIVYLAVTVNYKIIEAVGRVTITLSVRTAS
jgi:hypothetical protein